MLRRDTYVDISFIDVVKLLKDVVPFSGIRHVVHVDRCNNIQSLGTLRVYKEHACPVELQQ